MVKIYLAALFSVAIIWLAPTKATPINNSTSQAKAKAVQPVTREKVTPIGQTEQQQVVVSETVEIPQPLTQKQSYMQQAGIAASDWDAVDYIISHESSWNPAAINYLACIGLYQACPGGNKPVLLTNCPDWQNNIVCSLREATSYAVARYGSWWQAQAAWTRQGWW